LKFLPRKSFARIFDPTTVIEDDNPSFEEECEGEKAKLLFFKKSSKLHKLKDYKGASPFLDYIHSCNQNHMIPAPLYLLGTRASTHRGTVNSEGFRMGDQYALALSWGMANTSVKY